MERLSNEYQNSLNQTKLVYDYYGTNQSSLALDYGLLMTPSIYNDYYPKLVTDAKNRVFVLNASYAAAAELQVFRQKVYAEHLIQVYVMLFIEALAGQNIITPTKAATIQATSYGNQIGLGSTVSVNASTTDVNFEELMSLIMAKHPILQAMVLQWVRTTEKILKHSLVEMMPVMAKGGQKYYTSIPKWNYIFRTLCNI